MKDMPLARLQPRFSSTLDVPGKPGKGREPEQASGALRRSHYFLDPLAAGCPRLAPPFADFATVPEEAVKPG
jgi:hypothetical protein